MIKKRHLRLAKIFLLEWLVKIPSFYRNQQKCLKHYKAHYSDKLIALIPTEAIGTSCMFANVFMRYCQAHAINPQKDVVFIITNKVCNQQLFKMLKRVAHVVCDDYFYYLIENGGEKALEQLGVLLFDDYRNGIIFYPNAPLSFDFTEEEFSYGQQLISKIGISLNRPYVLFHSKDDVYWTKVRNTQKPWDTYRSSPFEDLIPSIQWLKEKGVASIRMGHYEQQNSSEYHTLEALNAEEKDFMDIFLQRYALFSVAGTSGIANIPYLFKTLTLHHNMIPMGEAAIVENGVILPKRFQWIDSGKEVPLSALLQIKAPIAYSRRSRFVFKKISADKFQDAALYKENNLKPLNNSPEDLLSAVQDTYRLALHEFDITNEEIQSQQKFKNVFPITHPVRRSPGIIAPSFLKRFPSFYL